MANATTTKKQKFIVQGRPAHGEPLQHICTVSALSSLHAIANIAVSMARQREQMVQLIATLQD